MGRRETVMYECDWCGRTSLEESDGYGNGPPANWAWVDPRSELEMLCNDCHDERSHAIHEAKAKRVSLKESEGGK